jgi:hypothetical protein
VLSYKFDLVIVCIIENTFSNLFLVYKNAYLNGTSPNSNGTLDARNKTFTNLTMSAFNSASRRDWDTFKVTSVSCVPNSRFVVVSLDGFGAVFYHTGNNEIIYKFNLTMGLSSFTLQDE